MKIKHVKKLESGKYEIRFSYIDELTGKRRRVRRRIEGTLSDAIELRDRLKVKAHDGELNGPRASSERRPLSEWLDDYLEHRQRQVAASTFKNESYQFRGPIIDAIGDWQPEGIELHHLDELMRRWETEDISLTTVRNRRGHLIRFLRWVFKRVGRRPSMLQDVEAPRRKSRSKRGRSMTPQEAQQFLTVFRRKYPHHLPLVFTLLVTGQRWGSVTALQWSDIDREEGTITFRRSHYRGSVRDGNKSGDLVRIPLPDELADVLDQHRYRMVENQHPNLHTNLVFPTATPAAESSTNGYQVSGDLRGPFETVCKEAEIEPVTPHDLRRTHNTWLVEQGISGTVIRSITGHSDEAMTDHYYRGSQSAKRRAIGSVLKLVDSS